MNAAAANMEHDSRGDEIVVMSMATISKAANGAEAYSMAAGRSPARSGIGIGRDIGDFDEIEVGMVR
jgi:hypothetical protein